MLEKFISMFQDVHWWPKVSLKLPVSFVKFYFKTLNYEYSFIRV